MTRHAYVSLLNPLGQAIALKQVPDTATPEFFALRYMARMINDPRIPDEVKKEIAEVLLPCLVPVAREDEG
jgi:hypothetical protein